MMTSQIGRALISRFEGCKLKAYLCPAGIATIGIGHTGPDVTLADVKAGKTITLIQADALLAQDLAATEAAVTKAVKVPLTQGQFDALVSFTYNLGAGALQRSSVLASLNIKDFANAARNFLEYDKARVKGVKQVLPGLAARRAAEKALFEGSA
ncbi:MAG: lysozyme [Burkholderiales bacterium]|nr:lysozyme [Burkholderiales bacterium]